MKLRIYPINEPERSQIIPIDHLLTKLYHLIYDMKYSAKPGDKIVVEFVEDSDGQ